jgi:molybdopterin/thiamine biosynthesis adenylyltransferase
MDQSSFEPLFARQVGYLEPAELKRLAGLGVAVLGLGGVGGVAAELLARSGLGRLIISDPESFEPSNLNRQVGALRSTLGQAKASVMADRLQDINPGMEIINPGPVPAEPDQAEAMLHGAAAMVLAVDALVPALAALRAARQRGIPVVEAVALPVIQVRIFLPQGPDPEQGLPSQGLPLDRVEPRELAEAYARLEADRLKDGRGGPLALPAGLTLAMVEGNAAPSLGPLVWLAGSLAALETLKLLCGRGRSNAHSGLVALDPIAWRLFSA